MSLWPVVIPSKGRPEVPTLKLLPEDAEISIVVEPQDAAAYDAAGHGDRMLVLPANDQGICYVRNWIQNLYAEYGWFWMIDDDMTGFYRKGNKSTIPCSASEALSCMQDLAVRAKVSRLPNLAMVGLQYQQFLWSATKQLTADSRTLVCVGCYAPITSTFSYDYDLPCKEDIDFLVQLLTSGYNTLRSEMFGFSCPGIGSNSGGLDAEYEQGTDRESVMAFYKKWGDDVCKPQTKKNGSTDIKVFWQRLSSLKKKTSA